VVSFTPLGKRIDARAESFLERQDASALRQQE
jgi:hypothetical protein